MNRSAATSIKGDRSYGRPVIRFFRGNWRDCRFIAGWTVAGPYATGGLQINGAKRQQLFDLCRVRSIGGKET
jgi:hypothetical protein